MKKITVALLRELEKKVAKEEITYQKMVELLNEHVFGKENKNK
jgi:hypothetical protein